MEPTDVRLLLVMVAERLALGAAEQTRLPRRVARLPDDDPQLRTIAERIRDGTAWKTIEVEILSPDFPVPEQADRGAFLHEVLRVVSRMSGSQDGSAV